MKIKNVNLFDEFRHELNKSFTSNKEAFADGNIMRLDDSKSSASLLSSKVYVTDIHEIVSLFARQFRLNCLERGIPSDQITNRLYGLLRAVDSQIHSSLT